MNVIRKAALGVALVLWSCVCALAQAPGVGDPFHLLSAASTNSTLVKTGDGIVTSIVVINTTTTLYYLKFYDIGVAPTCNTTPVKLTIPVPFGAANAGGGVVVPMPVGFRFFQGIGICLTGGIADNDNTNAATGVAINLGFR